MAMVASMTHLAHVEVFVAKHCAKDLMKLFKCVVNCQHGSGLIMIKFHICLHFFENNLDLGVTSNFDTGPMESNHRINAKNHSKRTQMRAEGFEEGTAHRYIEDLVLDVAAHELSRLLPIIHKGRPKPSTEVLLLQGAKYTIIYGEETLEHDLGGTVTFQWDQQHVVANGYQAEHIQWLCNHLLQIWVSWQRFEVAQNTLVPQNGEVVIYSVLISPTVVAHFGMTGHCFNGGENLVEKSSWSLVTW
jgi:hypothetical protein